MAISDSSSGIAESTIQAIGGRLEMMYHVSAAMHELCDQLIDANTSRSIEPLITAIREMAKSQARDLDRLSGRLTGNELGYYELHFESDIFSEKGGAA